MSSAPAVVLPVSRCSTTSGAKMHGRPSKASASALADMRALDWFIADRLLRCCAVRIEYVGRIVVLGVAQPQSRRAIVRAAGGKGRGVKCIDGVARFRDERDVQTLVEHAGIADPEFWIGRHAEAEKLTAFTTAIHEWSEAERRERARVELAAAREVGNTEVDVVDHDERRC